jgi:hypothetical protein
VKLQTKLTALKRFSAPKSFALLLVFVLLGTVLPVRAQTSNNGSGLSISPVVSEFAINPGDSQNLDIRLKNITTGSVTAKPVVNDFESDNTSGTPQIITDPNKHDPHSIKKFVSGLSDVPLNKGEQKKVSVKLQVPSGTSAGAYYGVIRYKAVPSGVNAPKEGEVSLSASVGTIVLITVPGNVKQQVQLTALHIYNGSNESSFFFSKPTTAGVELKNLGTDFAKPFGTVVINGTNGKQVYTYQLNNAKRRANILPDSSRIFKDPIKNINSPGRYTLVANITYGTGSDILVMKKTFWYVPLWLAIIILVIVLALIIWAVRAFPGKGRGKRSARRKG